jgi:hypothetical protein
MSADFYFKTGPNQPAFSVETPVRAFEPTRPYPQNPSAIIYRTRFIQLRAYYVRPTANTPHPNLPQVYFADDVDFQDRTSGLVEWTRIYATLPDSWTDFESYAYNFPGYQAGIGLNRQPITKTITSRLTEDYFIVGTLTNFSNLLVNYDDMANISWQVFGATTSANQTSIPICAGGTVTAAKITESSSNARHMIYQNDATNYATKSGACFVKAAERTVAKVCIYEANYYRNDVVVDLNTGLVLSSNAKSVSVAAIDGGWWRIGVTSNYTANYANLMIMSCDSNGNDYYQGDGTSGIYAWRGQLVTGTVIPAATVPPTTTVDGNSYPIANPGIIPVKFGQQYLYNWNNTVAAYLGSGSTPNYNTYSAWVTADQAATSNGANSYSIEATDSVLNLWNGSMWSRQRRFVKAR